MQNKVLRRRNVIKTLQKLVTNKTKRKSSRMRYPILEKHGNSYEHMAVSENDKRAESLSLFQHLSC